VREWLLSFGAEYFVFQFFIQKFEIEMYRTIILPVVLYGCETWSLTLREEQRLRMFENKVLRRIFGPRRDKVTGECKEYLVKRCCSDRPSALPQTLSDTARRKTVSVSTDCTVQYILIYCNIFEILQQICWLYLA
jgi:hypothetical protein